MGIQIYFTKDSQNNDVLTLAEFKDTFLPFYNIKHILITFSCSIYRKNINYS